MNVHVRVCVCVCVCVFLSVFKKIFPHDTSLKMISASWGDILSHVCCGTSAPPPPQPPLSARRGSPSVEPRRGGGVRERGSDDHPPPPAQANFPPAQGGIHLGSTHSWLDADATFFFGMVDRGSIACSDCPPFPGCRSESVLPTPALWHIHYDTTTANSGSVVLSRPKFYCLRQVHLAEKLLQATHTQNRGKMTEIRPKTCFT